MSDGVHVFRMNLEPKCDVPREGRTTVGHWIEIFVAEGSCEVDASQRDGTVQP